MTASAKKLFRPPPALLGLAVLFLVGVRPPSLQAEGRLEKVKLTVVFTKNSFIGVSRNDAEAAFKAFTENVGRKRGYLIETETEVFHSVSELDASAKRRAMSLFILDTWDYLSLRTPEVVEPKFVAVEERVAAERYLLLTQSGSGLNQIDDLRGRDIAVLENMTTNLAGYWLETLLLEKQLGTQDEFFRDIKIVEKASTSVLPVFFGNRHACVVDESAFAVMTEMNPQVGRRLQSIAASEPYVDSLIAFSRSGWETGTQREDMCQGLAELHLEPEGQQILNLFKASKLIPFKESHLDTVRELRATHDRLRNESH